MFRAIARFDIRFRWPVLALWLIAVPLAVHFLPSLSSVTQTSNSQFLSATAPSQQASKLAVPFEGKNPSATAVLVAVRDAGPLTAADNAAITRVEHAAAGVPGVSLVRDEGTSADGTAREALVVSGSSQGNAATTVVTNIRAEFAKAHAPAGLEFHLTGQLAENVDSSNTHSSSIAGFTILFIIILLFLVYRAVLAPLVTLIPAGLALLVAGPVIAEAAKAGLSVSAITQELLIVLMLGAGTDYGLFLVFRVREELGRGLPPKEAVVAALGRVGETITYSALTVTAALLTLLLASFGIYRGLGPGLAIGLGILLLASLTLTPALIAIFGRVLFWPSRPQHKPQQIGIWGRLADTVIRRPAITLAAGVVIFGALAAGLAGYQSAGFTNGAPAGSDSAAGAAVLAAHFPQASAGSDSLLLRFGTPVWENLNTVARAGQQLSAAPVFKSVSGPLNPDGTHLSAGELARLHAQLGPAALLPATPPAGSTISPALYAAYRATAQYISPDGRTLQFYATMSAGPPGTTAAANAIPAARAALASVATSAGASAHGIAGQDAASYDISQAANHSLASVVPVVLVILLVLLALLLRSLVAPWYLVITVGLSYLASLGFATIVFVKLAGDSGLNFVLPFLMFVFSMALGEDYNILVMSRIREEAGKRASFRDALTHAVGITGGTVTSAGLILAGTFVVLGSVAGNSQAQQLGFSIAFGVFLDTFFVRTLLVPSIASMLGRANWWPSRLSRLSRLVPAVLVPPIPGGEHDPAHLPADPGGDR